MYWYNIHIVYVHNITGHTAAAIADRIESQIQAGALEPEAALPTVRALAGELGVSPSTVAGAYKTLQARGLLVARGRRGTAVSARPPVYPGSALPTFPPGVRNLALGNPDPALLPDVGAALRQINPSPVLYGDSLVDLQLAARAKQWFRTDGIDPRDICVVAGALDGLERVLAAHLRPGDRVVVEDPAFVGVRDLLAALGLTAVPVEIDDSGPRPDALARALDGGAQALIVTPRAQNPTGACLDPDRVAALTPILQRHAGVLVCEDDHASFVAGVPFASLVAATAPRRWAVVRSFAKSFGPDVRVAVLAADDLTFGRVEGRQRLGMRWVSHLMQRLVVALGTDRSVQRRLRAVARTYTERRSALVDALAAHGIRAHGRSGLNVWVPVREEAAVVARLSEAGWGVSAGERFRINTPPAIRISCAALRVEEAEPLARDLARILEPAHTSTIS